ncbi:MAG TPA: GNAT family N-acetyltransferase [Candidatus Krumholzibacteria bacterium]|nr:GNAT family N-acetyltransferase [Candidatus Krumholzibacteria bacterium]HPD71320.1 GNAT family N-acetyltransferase [Candidatus Krumholzibacteria bacterium]HRY38980.1 GNAT family N-acetyltransferase [Candidatus Krumholzibacteria bacterium]
MEILDVGDPRAPDLATSLAAVVTIHEHAFRGFFLTALGRPFLRQYYLAVARYPQGIFLVADVDGGVAGFAAGFRRPERFYATLRSRWPRLALPIVLGLARRPRLLLAVLGGVRRVVRGRAGTAASPGVGGGPAATVELASIAVSPAHAGRGVGRALLDAFNARAGAMGAARVVLTTDRDGNEQVVGFYTGAGFEIDGEFVQGRRRRMLRLCKRLGAGASGG